jgi:hypothetical protein
LIGVQLPEKYKENFDVSSEGASNLGGFGGMPPRKIFKSGVSEMPFPAFWEKINRILKVQKWH